MEQKTKNNMKPGKNAKSVTFALIEAAAGMAEGVAAGAALA